jgi:hypothetical protein
MKQLENGKHVKVFERYEMDMYDFIWSFLQILEHDKEEEIFIVNALIDFYNHLKE